MSDHSKIEWTDTTWNPVTGCTKVSAGCKHCYAERQWPRLSAPGMPYAGRAFTDVALHRDRLDQPLRWRKPRRVFVNSMSDLFHEDVPDEFIRAVFSVMARAQVHTFQVLTKRPERMRSILAGWAVDGLTLREGCGVILPNVQLGVSIENQPTADDRVWQLLQTPAAVRFVSAEPLLSAIDLNAHLWRRMALSEIPGWALDEGCAEGWAPRKPGLDWLIVGGESGPKARPMHPDWARSLRDQCADARVPFFFKQWGEWAPASQRLQAEHLNLDATYVRMDGSTHTTTRYDGEPYDAGDRAMLRVGKRNAGRLLDGRTWDEYPQAALRGKDGE